MIAVLDSKPEPQQVIALLEPSDEVIEVATDVEEEIASEPLDVDVELIIDDSVGGVEEIASEVNQQTESQDTTTTEAPHEEVETTVILPTMTEIISTKHKPGITSYLDKLGLTYDKADSLANLKAQLKAYVLSQTAA